MGVLPFMLLSLSLLCTSCKFEQEDYFDETASLRVTHMNQQIKQLLVEQSDTTRGKYGWVIQYFVAGTDDNSFEGFNLFGRFSESGRATLAGNHRYLRNGNANRYTEATSNYEMLAEEGPVLSFNTWNDVLTVLEDPVDPAAAPGTLANDGEGMRGDHNLVFSSLDGDTLTFRGERHSAISRFVPCDRPWDEYIAAVSDLKNYISNTTLTSYYVTNGTDTMYFSRLHLGYFNFCDRIVDPLNNKVLSCVFTPNGLRLHHSETLGESSFRDFTLAADSSCLVSENGQVKVIPCWDNYLLNRTTVWNMDESLFSATQQSLLSQIDAELQKYNSVCSVASIGLGKSSGASSVNGLVVTFYSNAAKTRTNTFGLSLTTLKTAFGQVSIQCDASNGIDNNLKAIATKAPDMENLMRQFAATLVGTYDITPDNAFLPTGAAYQPVSGGTAFTIAK